MLSQRTRIAAVGTLGTVAAFFLFGGFGALMGGGGGGSTDPESAVPKTSFIFATINLAELRRSPIHDVLFSDRPETSIVDRRALGISKMTEACGFDPLSRVETLAIAVPEDGEKGELGAAARVTVTREELERCTTALSSQKGAKTATTEKHGFAVVEADRGAQVAYGHGGLLVAGKGAWLDTMLTTADGKGPSVKDAAAHVELRSHLKSLAGFGAPTILMSALLPRSLRDRIRNEMASEVGEKDAAQSAMAGVLGVSAVGAAIKADPSGGSISAAAELVCDSPDACASVEKLVSKKRFEWSKELMLRMVGLGPLLDSIVVKLEGSRLVVTASAPADSLSSVLDRVLRLTAQRRRPAVPNDGPTVPKPPDERIPAKP